MFNFLVLEEKYEKIKTKYKKLKEIYVNCKNDYQKKVEEIIIIENNFENFKENSKVK